MWSRAIHWSSRQAAYRIISTVVDIAKNSHDIFHIKDFNTSSSLCCSNLVLRQGVHTVPVSKWKSCPKMQLTEVAHFAQDGSLCFVHLQVVDVQDMH